MHVLRNAAMRVRISDAEASEAGVTVRVMVGYASEENLTCLDFDAVRNRRMKFRTSYLMCSKVRTRCVALGISRKKVMPNEREGRQVELRNNAATHYQWAETELQRYDGIKEREHEWPNGREARNA